MENKPSCEFEEMLVEQNAPSSVAPRYLEYVESPCQPSGELAKVKQSPDKEDAQMDYSI